VHLGAVPLIAQIKGSATIIVATAIAGLIVMYGIKAMGALRVSEAGELEGLDIHEHGAPAYHPEYASMGYSPIPSSAAGNGGEVPAGARVSTPWSKRTGVALGQRSAGATEPRPTRVSSRGGASITCRRALAPFRGRVSRD
jgi:hypothetical protein